MTLASACCSASSRHCVSPEFPLDSAVKRCSSEVLKSRAERLGKGSVPKRLVTLSR